MKEKRLNIFSGTCMLNKHKVDDYINIPFNEAMCYGEVDLDIFSNQFVTVRYQQLKSNYEDYKRIVLNSLQPLFNEKFDSIHLNFGYDMFCQINLLTILAYLDKVNYDGEIYCNIYDEITDKIISNKKINIDNYYNLYVKVLCNKEIPKVNLDEYLSQAIVNYLSYLKNDSEIIKYIKLNIYDENLIDNLILKFPQYGLSDYQYQLIIETL